MKRIAFLFFFIVTNIFAAELTINGAEFGIGRFHRYGNKVNPYGSNSAWKVFVLPDGVSTKEAFVQKNADDNYTIFFTNLEEFLTKIVEVSHTTGMKVRVLNINAHGIPGGMWFPRNRDFYRSIECSSWQTAVNAPDETNYRQYYTAITKEDLLKYEEMSNAARIPGFSCLTGINEWTQIVARVPAIKDTFSSDAQVHMLSCLVGLGPLGDAYTTGLAKLLFPKPDSQQVQTAIKLGLGDWSMLEGMGFWGYESDEQIARDAEVYPVNRNDSEIAQRGDIRVGYADQGSIKSGLIKDEEFMFLSHDNRSIQASRPSHMKARPSRLPTSVRIPGTNVTLKLK